MRKISRNDSCPCGSGKKYKQCCLQRDEAIAARKYSEAALTAEALQAALKHQQAGRLPQAEAIYQQILRAEPNHPDALHLLGLIASQVGKDEVAVELIGKAILASPSNPAYYVNMGNALQAQGKPDVAAESYRKALLLHPDFAEAHYNLGNMLREQGGLDTAIEHYRKAILIKPDYVEAYNNLALALQVKGELGAAVDNYQLALSLKPDYAEGYNNLGNALREQGKPGAVECYNKAISIKPDYAEAQSNLLYWHAFTRDISPEAECKLASNWENISLDESERTAAHGRFSGSLDHPARAGRRLKIGVVSAEIGQHAVAEFLEPFLEQLDRSRFHVTLFPTAARSGSRTTRLLQLADEFKPLVGFSDASAAEQIRADRIDILIDTTGHMEGCRLGIFAHRAAPVQCHYIGYHGTTGLTEMDWFIADNVLLPSACDSHFREKIWRLPRLWISYRGDASLPGSHWQPSPDGTIWLGSFNNLVKVREQTLGLWAMVMNAIPESKLLLKDYRAADNSVRQRIRAELSRYGIDGERIEFAVRVPDWNSHMALYDRLDIALDTIPLNSGTTAFDALWMGVPLVALEGDWMGGRMTSTMLKALGKPEWVARNGDEYVAIVAALARNVEERKLLRATQRSLMAGSPLCDVKGLAGSLEDAFEKMFDRWQESMNGA